MDVIGVIRQYMLIRKNVKTSGLCYGNIMCFQGVRDLNECAMFDKKIRVVHRIEKKNGEIYYIDVFANKVYKDVYNKDIDLGDSVFGVIDSMSEFLDPNEIFLNKVKYLKLLDIYFEELTFEEEYKECGKVLKYIPRR